MRMLVMVVQGEYVAEVEIVDETYGWGARVARIRRGDGRVDGWVSSAFRAAHAGGAR